jgi:hypothetical protein
MRHRSAGAVIPAAAAADRRHRANERNQLVGCLHDSVKALSAHSAEGTNLQAFCKHSTSVRCRHLPRVPFDKT